VRIGLGTAQFGFKYGISNQSGQTPANEVQNILKYAKSQNIDVLDTAAGYGNSEEVLGQTLNATQLNSDFKIVTKTPSLKDLSDEKQVRQKIKMTFEKSLKNLQVSKVYGLLVHDCDDLTGPFGSAVYEVLLRFKEDGQVSKLGISIYDDIQIQNGSGQFKFDLSQVPVNIFNQKFIKNGRLEKLKKEGFEIHSRSVFLQGLLLMSSSELPAQMGKLTSHLDRYHKRREALGLSKVEAALSFALHCSEIDRVLCGVNDENQLKEIVKSTAISTSSDMLEFFDEFNLDDDELTNPARWAVK
jgi:aryl-alcohol dehydrogenase-like predicted oxidoreductase